jgi:hypothetical protein
MNIPIDVPPVNPIAIARQQYLKWKPDRPFRVDLENYLEDPDGIVISRPDIFAMAKVMHDPPTLFVRVAVGNLRTLLEAIPVHPPKITFYRRNTLKKKEWDLEKLLRTADKLMKRERTND